MQVGDVSILTIKHISFALFSVGNIVNNQRIDPVRDVCMNTSTLSYIEYHVAFLLSISPSMLAVAKSKMTILVKSFRKLFEEMLIRTILTTLFQKC